MTTTILFLIACYFCPTIVASIRKHPQRVPIALLNVFLGWTLIGWVVGLVWAAMRPSAASAAVRPGPVA